MKCRLYSSNVFKLILLVYIGIVAFLCFANFNTLPDVQRSVLGLPFDKIVHFCMFFPLPPMGFIAFGNRKQVLKIFLFLIRICAFSCIFAGITEIIQGTLPYRSEDIGDFGVDCLAVGISGVLTFIAAVFLKDKN